MGETSNREQQKTSGASWQGLAYLSAVYVIWGSTYLAIRVAVRYWTYRP